MHLLSFGRKNNGGSMRGATMLVAAAAPLCSAHFAMNKPISWVDAEGTFGMKAGWRGAGCTGAPPPAGEENVTGCISQWYSNFTLIPGNATIGDDSDLITYQKLCRSKPGSHDHNVCLGMARNPWRAPGSAPVWSPCGVDGGNPWGCPKGNPGSGGCVSGGYGHGPDGRTLVAKGKPAQWTAGSEVEVAFGITANHGGGYQYRLCPLPADGRRGITEECFQKTPLAFVGDTQWLQYDDDESNRTAIPAVRTSEGTFPEGSMWTRQPIPACGTFEGGGFTENGAFGSKGLCLGSQFEPPLPGVYGFYGQTPNDLINTPKGRRALTHWSVVDKVQIPKDLPAGDYVIGFRIDCEQTPQIWQQCGDVHISTQA